MHFIMSPHTILPCAPILGSQVALAAIAANSAVMHS